MSKESESVLFVETQHFPRFWFWFIVCPLAGLMWYGFYQQIILGKPFGTNPAPDTLLVIFWVLFGIGLPWMFYSAKLITEVRSDSLHIRLTPLVSRTVHFGDLKSYEARQYSPIRDFGGWGIRWWPGKGWAYTVGGSRALQLELLNGKRLLIGSENPSKLVEIIRTAKAD